MRVGIGLLLALMAAALPALAREIEGVSVPESATLADTPLILNGAGVRTRFFVKVYVGALYLPAKETDMEKIVSANGAKSVRLHFLYKEVDAARLTDGWTDGFKNNNTDTEFQTLAPRLTQFNALFGAARRGDTMRLDLLPNGETRVTINDDARGAIAGADFQRALLKVWLGDKPADSDLKRAMLGAKD